MPHIRDMADDLRKGLGIDSKNPALRLRKGTIQAVNGDGTVGLYLGGSTVAIPSIKTAAAYLYPVVGDNVWILQNGTDLLVLGVSAPSAPGLLLVNSNGATTSTNSTSYVNYGIGPYNFTKKYPNTSIYITGSFSAYETVAGATLQIAMNFNGADNFLGKFFFNTLSEHNSFGLGGVFSAPAGTYSMQPRWTVSAGVTANTDSNDYIYFRIEER